MPRKRPVLAHNALVLPESQPSGTVGLTAKRAAKATRLLQRLRYEGTTDRLAPFLADGESLLEGLIAEVTITAGSCGPGAASAMHSAAAQKSLAMFYYKLATTEPDPRESVRFARLSADLMDRSRANQNAALDLAVRIARTKPIAQGDPLAAFDVEPEPNGTDE